VPRIFLRSPVLCLSLLALVPACPADNSTPQDDESGSSGGTHSSTPAPRTTGSTPSDDAPPSAASESSGSSGSSDASDASGASDSSDSGSSDGDESTTGVEPICGNGTVEGDEECDSAVPSAVCDDDCTLTECGDGVVNAVAGETCDDGNGSNADACPDGPDGSCRAAECSDGFICTDPGCTSGPTGGTEDCDDGNDSDADGCSDVCRIEGDGCADGLREGFIDGAANPLIAGCSGGFTLPGTSAGPACGNAGGDDSADPFGTGCSVADLCADGWHVCESPDEVESLSATGCTNVTLPDDDPLFFVQQISGSGGAMCNGLGSNDIFGCGNVGVPPDAATCAPLNRFSQDGCGFLGNDWDCSGGNVQEAINVVKPGVDYGGALCCID